MFLPEPTTDIGKTQQSVVRGFESGALQGAAITSITS